jgi:hypothetical protein
MLFSSPAPSTSDGMNCPCQWMNSGVSVSLNSCTETGLPSRKRIIGPGTWPLYPIVLMVLSLVTSTRTGPMCKVTSAGPVLTGGVAVAEAIGICIGFCAPAEVGSINPLPAKVPASKNCRRDKPWPSRSIIVRRSPLGLGLCRSAISTTTETLLTEPEG